MDIFLFQKGIFSERLKKRRIECGFNSQQAFATAFNNRFRSGTELEGNNPTSGILGTIKHYEDPNHTGMPRLDIVVEICQLLDCEIDYLLGKISEPKHIYQDMLDKCGLSSAATDQLVYWNRLGKRYTKVLNYILTSHNFDHALYHASETMRAKPIYIGLSQIYNQWRQNAYIQKTTTGNYPDGSNLQKTYKQAEIKYEIERLRLNEYLTFLVSELEDISTRKE